ncbi:MAG: ABC transporter permease [Planctomycetes bacterium]|nr:ABC transporter permease [Planctomycetota bacterium]
MLAVTVHVLSRLGQRLGAAAQATGASIAPLLSTARCALRLQVTPHEILRQTHAQIVRSFLFVGVGNFCIGFVFALSLGHQLELFNLEIRTVGVLTVATVQTLGPIFTGLLLSGRVASGLAAEIGAMQRTEQLTAMRALSLDAEALLIAPRVIAVALGCVVLTLVADALTLCGGALVMLSTFDMLPHTFFARCADELRAGDVLTSATKALVFGLLIGGIGCAAGLREKKGTAQVGEDTKSAVVAASFSILVANVLLTRFFLWLYP